jgi:hypothetical protein
MPAAAGSASAGSPDASATDASSSGASFPTARNHLPGSTHHIVLFTLVDDSDEVVDEVTRRFLALAESTRDGAPYIRSVSGGRQISPEPGASAATLGFIVEFGSVGDRNFYLGRPFVDEGSDYDLDHDAFKHFVGPLLQPDGVEIFDYQHA